MCIYLHDRSCTLYIMIKDINNIKIAFDRKFESSIEFKHCRLDVHEDFI